MNKKIGKPWLITLARQIIMITGEIKKRIIRLKINLINALKIYTLVFFAIPINKLPLPIEAEIVKKSFCKKEYSRTCPQVKSLLLHVKISLIIN